MNYLGKNFTVQINGHLLWPNK